MAKFTDPIDFPPDWLTELDALEARWQGGDAAAQPELDAALALWRQRLHHPAEPREEQFDIVNAAGEPLGLIAPRWFAHLTGLRHRVVHVLLTTPQGHLALQMRAFDKLEWPDHLDTTVGGHLKAGQDWETGVMAEIHEEIGLAPADRHRWLAERMLTRVGEPFERYGRDEGRPPVRNRQVNQIYTGALTAWGLAHLHFADGELSGLFLTTVTEVRRMIATRDPRLAPGLRGVFPIWQKFQRGSESHERPAERHTNH
jgi:isopentenyldiphosphate isomerase